MKAAILPSLNSKWEIQEIQTPQPSTNQVLIKINASGLCYTDIHFTKGDLPLPHKLPFTLGHEPADEIVEVGEGVTTRKKGDRVGVPILQKTCVSFLNGVHCPQSLGGYTCCKLIAATAPKVLLLP